MVALDPPAPADTNMLVSKKPGGPNVDHVDFMLFVSISFAWVANGIAISGGIWALLLMFPGFPGKWKYNYTYKGSIYIHVRYNNVPNVNFIKHLYIFQLQLQ